MKFWNRSERQLERDLTSLRAEPTEEFIHSISSRVLRGRRVERSSRMKVGLAMSLTALGLVVFAVFGGLGYAGSAASNATKVVNVVKVSNTSSTVNVTPKPTTTTTTTTSTTSTTSTSSGKVITWTGNGTTGGYCSTVSGSGNTQTWQFNLTSPYSSGSATLTATFQSAGTKSATVSGSTSVIKWLVSTGKNDRLLSASATNGTKNSVLTISHCTLSGTPTGDSSDDDSSGGGGGGGNCSAGGGGGNSHSDDNDASSDDKSDAKSDDNDTSSDDNSDGGGHNGGGAGGNQYGGCIPICHKVSSGKYVLQLVSSTDVALHQSHGDIVPAPATGCPGGGGSNSDDDSGARPKCNSGRGNSSEGNSSQLIKPSTGSKGTSPTVDCDPGNSGSKNKGGD